MRTCSRTRSSGPAAGTASPSSRPRASASTTRCRPGTPHADVAAGAIVGGAASYPLVGLSNAANAQIGTNVAMYRRAVPCRVHRRTGAVLQAADAGLRRHAGTPRRAAGGSAARLVFASATTYDRARSRHPQQGLGQPRARAARTPSTATRRSRTSADFPACSACRPARRANEADPLLAGHGAPIRRRRGRAGGGRGGRGGDRRRLHRPVGGPRASASAGRTVVVLEAGQVASRRHPGATAGTSTTARRSMSADSLRSYGARSRPRLYHAYDAAVDTVERIVREQQITLRLPPRRQDQACCQARALRKDRPQLRAAARRASIRKPISSRLRASATRSARTSFPGGLRTSQERADAHGALRRRPRRRGGAARRAHLRGCAGDRAEAAAAARRIA